MTLLNRIKNWRRGYYRPAFDGAVDEPPICQCGHYRYIHEPDGCFGWARDQWARLGPLSWHLRCRCRIGRMPISVPSSDTTTEEAK